MKLPRELFIEQRSSPSLGRAHLNLSRRRLAKLLGAAIAFSASLMGLRWTSAEMSRLTDAEMAILYSASLTPPPHPLRVFHLGHSLVGRDMPAMLAQLAPMGHGYESQLGWGASLKVHWEPDLTIAGFEEENAHPRYRDVKEALRSGEYDALILTEMVEIRDAIRYHQTGDYLRKWAEFSREGNPEIRVYLYETWHDLNDPEGWLSRIDRDFGRYWDRAILRPALSNGPTAQPIYLIPAGQVIARFVREIEGPVGVEGLKDRWDLFGRTPAGSPDSIHLGDLGNYLVALTHYAVLYGQSPVGLAHALLRADGSPADAPSSSAARIMQEIVWQVVSAEPLTGVGRAQETG